MPRFLGMRGAKLGTVISATCGLCFLCFGYAQGVMGGLLTVAAFLERFPQVDTINNASERNALLQGAVVGTWNLGCFASAILTIFIGDYLGRRKTLMLGLSFWVAGEIIQCSSFSFGQFIAGRAVAGFGNGFTTSTVPAYQVECVKSHRKGTILMISAGAFIALGLALSYWLVFAFAYLSNYSASWRIPIAFQIVFALVAFSILLFLPESPRWLILTGREQEALEVLSALNGEDIDGPEIRDEFLQIKDAILVMSQGSTSSLTSNTERRNFHRVVLAYFVQVFQQMSGINLALQYLAIMLYTQMSFTGWVARLIGACAATEYFLASFITVIGIDRFWGRRSLMMFGAAGMCLCMVLLTVLIYLWKEHGVGGTNIAATVFLFGFSTFFAVGWQGMAWLYQVEVVPLRIRGPANALSTSANWLFNFVVVFIAPIAFRNIGYRTYIIFACTNFAIVPLIYFLYPETAYRSLEEVDVLFHIASQTPGNPWLNVVRISKEEPLWFGKKGEVAFDYERSDWHQHYLHFQNSGTTLQSGEKEKPSRSRSAANTAETLWLGSNGSAQRSSRRNTVVGPGGATEPPSSSGGAGGVLFPNPEAETQTRNPISRTSSYINNQAQNNSTKSFPVSQTNPPSSPPPVASNEPTNPRRLSQRNESYNSQRSVASVASSHHSNRSEPHPLYLDSTQASSQLMPKPLIRASPTASIHNNVTGDVHNRNSSGGGPATVLPILYPGSADDEKHQAGIKRTGSMRDTYFPDGLEGDDGKEFVKPSLGSRRSSMMARESGRAK